MSTKVPPEKDSELLTWGSNFASLVHATPEAFGVPTSLAGQLNTKFLSFQSALETATTPATRGGASILAKDLAKKDFLVTARSVAKMINSNVNVTDVQRHDLGLNIREPHYPPLPVPSEMPEIDILSVVSRTVKGRLHSATHGRGRPPGVQGATLYTFIGENPPSDLSGWTVNGNASKTTFEIDFAASVEPGTRVWITAAWYNPRGQLGPACEPVSTHIQFGGVSMENAANLKVAA